MRKVVAAAYLTSGGVMQDPGDAGESKLGGWSKQAAEEQSPANGRA
jgi:hypothetical protein